MIADDPLAFDPDAPALSSADVFDDPLAFGGLSGGEGLDAPAFALIDDAGGRFTIDAATGVVSLAHEDIFEGEKNSMHAVRLKVREPWGENYELTLRLKITGAVPQMAGGEALFPAAPEPCADPPKPTTPWRAFAAFLAQDAHCPIPNRAAPFGDACAFGLEDLVEADAADFALAAPLPRPADDSAWA